MIFVPFNPRMLRLGSLACAIACLAVTAWALENARHSAEPFAAARAGISAGLMFAFLFVFTRLRQRENWGVKIDSGGLTVSRPLSAEPFSIAWSDVRYVVGDAPGHKTLVVMLTSGGRLHINRAMFQSRAVYEELVLQIARRAPKPKFDA